MKRTLITCKTNIRPVMQPAWFFSQIHQRPAKLENFARLKIHFAQLCGVARREVRWALPQACSMPLIHGLENH